MDAEEARLRQEMADCRFKQGQLREQLHQAVARFAVGPTHAGAAHINTLMADYLAEFRRLGKQRQALEQELHAAKARRAETLDETWDRT